MKITIVGASGHGRVVADIAMQNGFDEIEFLDDNSEVKSCGKYPVVGTTDKIVEGDMIIAIGNASIRERLMRGRKNVVTLIHPRAVVADDAEIGEGSVVMAGAVINSGAKIGRGVIVNTCSSIDHDCVVGDYAHVAVGAHLCGTVNIGRATWIGAGSTISNNISVCSNCIIGAGAVVVKSIESPGIYIGVPARKK